MNSNTISIWEKENSLAKNFWEKGEACPVYDMHGHMGTHYSIYFPYCEPDTMAEYLRRSRITHLVFTHQHAMWGSMRNAQCVEICKKYPDIYSIYVAINPHFQDHVKEDLKLFDSWQPYAVGLKFLPDYHQVAVDDKRNSYALDFAEERGLPVLCHTWGGSSCNGGAVMTRIAEKYHNLKLLMGHSIFGEFDVAAQLAKDHPNVYLELTAIPGEQQILEKLVSIAGSRKIFFGTDMPWFDEYQAIGGILSAKITEDDMRNILYRNAEKLLGIK